MKVTIEQIEAAEKNLAFLRQQRDDGATTVRGLDRPPENKRSPEVMLEISELSDAIMRLEKTISILHDRLSMVTRPPTPCGASGGEEPDSLVPTVSILREQRRKVFAFNCVLADLIDRLEV